MSKKLQKLIIFVSLLTLATCFQNFSVPDNATSTLLVNLHNIERSAIGVKNLTWSASLANSSQDWANYLAANSKFVHSGASGVGENLAGATFRSNLTAYLFGLWSAEKQYFNPNYPYGVNSRTDSTKEVGHYTQVIWSYTYLVGCGIANTSTMSIMVCQYSYAGNFVGEWVYKPNATNPWLAAQPVVDPASLPAPWSPNTYPTVLDNTTASQILDLHNIERTFVGMKNLTWSQTLAVSAQSWANKQAQAGTFYLSGTAGVGENMKLVTIRPNIVYYMVAQWINERVYFDATLRYPNCAINGNMISHYTQMVWSASVQVGCGVATNTNNAIMVCQYSLAGNYIGNYVVYPAPTTNFNFTTFY